MFELKIAEEIEREAKLSHELLQEGFSHAFRAGELIQEVKSMLNWEREEPVEGWLGEYCSEVDLLILKNCMKIFNGGTVSVEARAKKGMNNREGELS